MCMSELQPYVLLTRTFYLSDYDYEYQLQLYY